MDIFSAGELMQLYSLLLAAVGLVFTILSFYNNKKK